MLLISTALATGDAMPFTLKGEFDGPDSSVDSEDDSVELELSEEELSLSAAFLPVTISLPFSLVLALLLFEFVFNSSKVFFLLPVSDVDNKL